MNPKPRRPVLRKPEKLKVRANLQGRTEHFTVYAQPSLPAGGAHHARAVLARCEDDYQRIRRFFGGIEAGPFNVILFWHPAGAYHDTCAARDLFCDAPIRPDAGEYSEFLTVMEFVEVFESRQGRGWSCGKSNGEGLSRVLGKELYPHLLDGFATAASWLDSPRKNFVDRNYQSDLNDRANGCSALFLNWLHVQLRYQWKEIVGAGGPTLGATYATLTGKKDGFEKFRALLDAHFPRGRKSRLATDNPFPL